MKIRYGINVRPLSTPETYYSVMCDAHGNEKSSRVSISKEEYEKVILTEEVTQIMADGTMYYGSEYQPETGNRMRSMAYYKVLRDADGKELEEREYIPKAEFQAHVHVESQAYVHQAESHTPAVVDCPETEAYRHKGAVVDGVYEHIGNGGVSFGVTNENGPTIVIEVSHFGHVTNQIKLHVTQGSLFNLSRMFSAAHALTCNSFVFDKDYVCASESRLIDKNTGKTMVKEGRENVAYSSQTTIQNKDGE